MSNILTVTEISTHIKNLMARDALLTDVWVKGEISNFKLHSAGHMYFTLKDDMSVLKCVMFRGHAAYIKFAPKDGMNVVLRGYISVFEKAGQYQLYATKMEPDGIGGLYLAFQQLQEKLKKQGYFDQDRKKKLPFIPDTVCVVTSPTGAVIRDITNVMFRRFPNIHMRVFSVAVQGDTAAAQIAHAIEVINSKQLGDVIIIARGGGSLEDLWPFNEEKVANAIFESAIPIISAVGHETDFTISDFVSDKRAPTPSAAAELVVPEKLVLKENLSKINNRLSRALLRQLEKKKDKYRSLLNSVVFKQPYNRIYQERMGLEMLDRRIVSAMRSRYHMVESKFNITVNKLEMVNPLKILKRGYSVISGLEDNIVVKSAKNLKRGDRVRLTLSDGSASCLIDEVKEEAMYAEGRNEI